MASDSDSDSYQFEPTFFIAPSSPMVGAHPDPFQGGLLVVDHVYSPTITGNPSSGHIGPGPMGPLSLHTLVVGSLPTSGGSFQQSLSLQFHCLT